MLRPSYKNSTTVPRPQTPGADKNRQDDERHSARKSDRPFRSVALAVGSTGIVGTSLVHIPPRQDTPGGPWKVYALSRRRLPPWSTSAPSSTLASVIHVHVDLTDARAVAEALAPLNDITHVFYVAWTPRDTEAQNQEANSAMFRNVLSAAITGCPAIVHVCLQTGTKHYIGPFELVGKVPSPEPPYTEDMPRLDCPNFYYDQEDILFDETSKRGGAVSWSVHRPSVIFGFSPRSTFNIVCSLCVYAAICQKDGAGQLRWPGSRGSWEEFVNASDADLIAEQQIWAAVAVAKNEAFNCCNGDIYKWKQLWPVLAGRFGLEWYAGEENRFSVAEAMAGKEDVWAEIVKENGLVETQLSEVANWWLIDVVVHEHGVIWKLLDSMNKSKEHGFFGFRNTVKSFDSWIDKMKAYKIVP